MQPSDRERKGTAAPSRGRRQRGAALVEFALIALALYLLLAGGIEIGRAVFSAQLLQDVARAAARELALTRLPASTTFDDALEDCDVRRKIFDPAFLVIDLDRVGDLDAHFAEMPLVNQMLRPLMIVDIVTIDGQRRRLLRYPGALLRNRETDPCGFSRVQMQTTEFTVGIPMVVGRDRKGHETITWVPVIEEVRPDPDDKRSGPFSVNGPGIVQDGSGNGLRGVVALRINYPYQAAMLSAYRPRPRRIYEPNLRRPVLADDGAVTQLEAPPGDFVTRSASEQVSRPGTEFVEGGEVGPYAGPYGLGRLEALGESVRPFRRVISAQAIFRREVFE
jgi:hypothetical protein